MRETFVSLRQVEDGQNSEYGIVMPNCMRPGMRHLVLAFVVLALMWCLPPARSAQWRPTSPVEIITSTGVGGAQDRLARVLQGIIQDGKLTSVPVVVANRPGGAGTIALAYLNRSPSDGQSLLVTSAQILSNHILGRSKFSYTDTTPIAQLFHEYPVLVVGSASSIRDASDLIARLKKSAHSLSVGVATLGSVHHLSLAQAAGAAGVNPRSLKIVTFKSGSDALTATIGGHIDASISSVSNVISQLEAGTVRALVISAPQRLAGNLANVPTWKDVGLDSVFSNFRTIFGPQGLSASQIAYWDSVLSKLASSPAWMEEEKKNFWVSGYLNSAQTREALVSEYGTQKSILAALGMAKQ